MQVREDQLTIYFLRRMAKARYRDPEQSLFVAFHRAVAESALVFVLFPLSAILSGAGILSMKLAPHWLNIFMGWFQWNKGLLAIAFVALPFAFSCVLLARHFRTFRENADALIAYDTERDRLLVFRQKFWAFVVCALLMPNLALLTIWWMNRP